MARNSYSTAANRPLLIFREPFDRTEGIGGSEARDPARGYRRGERRALRRGSGVISRARTYAWSDASQAWPPTVARQRGPDAWEPERLVGGGDRRAGGARGSAVAPGAAE